MNENLTSYEIQKITEIFDKVEIIDKKKSISKRNKNYIKWFLIILFFCITLIWIWFYIYANSENNTKNAEIFWLFFFAVLILFIVLNLILFLKNWLTWEPGESWYSQYDYLNERINKYIYPLISPSYSHFNYRWISLFLNDSNLFSLNQINDVDLWYTYNLYLYTNEEVKECNITWFTSDHENNKKHINNILYDFWVKSEKKVKEIFDYYYDFFFPLWEIIQKLIKNKLFYGFYWSYFYSLATFNIKDTNLVEKKVFFNTNDYNSPFDGQQNNITSNFHIIDEKYDFQAPVSIINKLEDKLRYIYADLYVSIAYVSILFYMVWVPVISLYIWSFLLQLNFVILFFDYLNNFYYSFTNSILISSGNYANFMYVLFIILWYYLFYRLLKLIHLEYLVKKYYIKFKKIDLNNFDNIFEIKTSSIQDFDIINNNFEFKKILVEYYQNNKKNMRFCFIKWSLNIFITSNLVFNYPWFKNEKNNVNYYVNKITDYRKSINLIENVHNTIK